MRDAPLTIEEFHGASAKVNRFILAGPLTLANLFAFQAKLRADDSERLVLDFSAVPYIDSAGIGALVGNYVSRKNKGRTLALAGVNQRVRDALTVTQVETFFEFYDNAEKAEAG